MSAIEFQNVSFSYPGGHQVLHDVSFSIEKGEKVALVGLNRSGKTTLRLHTTGLLMADRGTVLVDG
ncbi:MAG: ATP-binding cassette domain-containing protein, partial [Muribaculaceae bacterium]|nr:ATP-binding cassette domain-containing protein [Muribaculaceae bacterium]